MKKRFTRAAALILSVCALASFCACGEVAKTKEIKTELTQSQVVLKSTAAEEEVFSDFFKKFVPGFTVPGLLEGAIPQGLCHDDENGIFIISAYYEKAGFASVLMTVTDSGTFKGYYPLLNTDGTVYDGHAGGLACDGGTVYITSDGECRTIDETRLFAKSGTQVKFDSNFKITTKGSFANVSNGILWTGDFIESSQDEREKSTSITTLESGETFYALCEGYVLKDGLPDVDKINSEANGYIPDYYIAVPEQVQGMTVTLTGDFIFSTSYGRKNNSVIYVFGDILDTEKATTLSVDGKNVDVYACSTNALKKTYTALPMAEGIVTANEKVYLLFESGASKYRSHGGKFPTDRVYIANFG